MAVILEDVEQMKYWSMWLVALVQWHHLVDPTKQMHGHWTYNEKTDKQVGEQLNLSFISRSTTSTLLLCNVES